MEQTQGKWFEKNQAKLQELTPKDVKLARHELAKYVKLTLKGRTEYGAHSVDALHEEAVAHYVQTSWEKLYAGVWEWKEGRTLIGQLCRIASCLMEKQVKKWRRAKARGEAPEMLNVDELDYRLADHSEEDAERKEEGYRMIFEALKKCKPELTAYVEAVREGGSYEDIAERMGLEVVEVMKIERRVIYKIKKYRDEHTF